MKTTQETTVKNLNKTVRIGNGDCGDIFCKIEIHDGKLSITGVEGPMRNGHAKGSCGQIVMHEWSLETIAPGWSVELIAAFRAIWNRWHLNDMVAGSPAQMQWLRDNPIPESEYVYPKNHYTVVCEKLAAVGLNPDNGYSYGDSWNREELPQSVWDFLAALPDTDKTPAWV